MGAGVVAFTTVAGSGIASGRDDSKFKSDVQRARELRAKRAQTNVVAKERKVNPNDVFVNYLRQRGYRVSTNTEVSTFSFGSDGVSSQKLEPNDSNELYATINITARHFQCDPDPHELYAEYFWEWDVDSGYGEPAKDLFAYSWPEDSAQIINDSWDSSGNCEMFDRGNSLNGISFKYDDTVLTAPDYDHGYGGVDATPESGLSDDDTWAGKWEHTYEDTEICGFSVSSDGAMDTDFCINSESDNGGFTQTDYADADHQYTNC